MKLIAIIPARSTSKRLPNKNFRKFYGRRMIEWVLDEVKKSEIFDKIIVSTDTAFIYDGVEVRKRSGDVAEYDMTVDDVCLDLLNKGNDWSYVCVIYPTAYVITWDYICQSFALMIEKNKDFYYSHNMLNGSYNLDNGGFYWCKVASFLKEKTVMGENQGQVDIPMVDINTLQDFCEAKLHASTMERFKCQNT